MGHTSEHAVLEGSSLERREIRPDEAHVWVVDPAALRGTSLLRDYQALLSADEVQRMGCYVFDDDRLMFQIARGLARTALSWCAPAVAPAAWVFERNRYGRPEVVGPRVPARLRFNVSHTPGLVACVVTTEADCGIDVEVVERNVDVQSLGARVLTPRERAAVDAVPVTERRARFFRYWTLKEAYAKARGLGMSLPFERFEFELSSRRIDIRIEPGLNDSPADWRFDQWFPTGLHTLALALRAERRIIQHTVPPEVLR